MAKAITPSILFIEIKVDLKLELGEELEKVGRPKLTHAATFEKVDEITESIVVMPFSLARAEAAEEFLCRIDNVNPLARKILLVEADVPLERIAEINARHGFLRFVGTSDVAKKLSSALTSAVHEARTTRAENPAKNKDRLQKRKQKITQRVGSLQKALMAVHTAVSVAEIETQLYEALKQNYQLSWVRIFLHGSEHFDSQLDRVHGQHVFKQGLLIGPQHLGKIAMARSMARPFTKVEHEALLQISESVALALDRIAKIDQAENLKQQWESTFDAVSEPLCITDEKFQIIRTNRAFLSVTKLKSTQALGQNCFKIFCREAPKSAEIQGLVVSRSEVRNKEKQTRFYEVTTQRIRSDELSMVLVLFRDITERKGIEDRILESAKMAELGTVGSSIAHDINNPLGGMMSFLQLIKMDLPPDHALRADIERMEAACRRCKEIVENLLQFSRRQENAAAETLDLRLAIKQAVKIIELQTRSLGIEVEVLEPDTEVKIVGHFSLLAQALSQIFQASFEAVADRLQKAPGFRGHIKIELRHSDQLTQIIVGDNGVVASPEQQNRFGGLNQTLVQQILSEHGGTVDMVARSNVGTTVSPSAKIAFINV